MKEQLAKAFEIKYEILGTGKGQARQLRLLSRVLSWNETGLTWEAGPRHLEVLVESLGLQGKKGLRVPGGIDTKEELNAKKEEWCRKAPEKEARAGECQEEVMANDDGDDDFEDEDVGEARVFSIGGRVRVVEHGSGVVAGRGRCGYTGMLEIEYEYGTGLHCEPRTFSKLTNPTRGMVRCHECAAWQVEGKARRICQVELGHVDGVDGQSAMGNYGW